MLNSDNRNLFYTVLLSIAFIILISLIYGLRKDIFYAKNVSETQALEEGIGFYEDFVSMGCVTEDGLCDKPGTETFVSRCIPNPSTGKGCIDEETGTMTFKSIVKKEKCDKNCIKYSFSIQRGVSYITKTEAENKEPDPNLIEPKQVFKRGVNRVIDNYYGIDYTSQYFGDYNVETQKYDMKVAPGTNYPICIPDNLTGYYQTKYVCSPNDQSGINMCKYMCGIEKTISTEGIYENNASSNKVLMHYPFYTQDDGEKFYFCYDQLGNNLLEGLYNTPTVEPDFIFPKQCFTRYITNFSNYGLLDMPVTYSSDYIVLEKELFPVFYNFDDSDVDLLNIPESYTDEDNGSLMIAKVGVEFMKVLQLNQDVKTLRNLSDQYFLYSKTEIQGLSGNIIEGVTSGEFVYIYNLFIDSDYEEITFESYNPDTGEINFKESLPYNTKIFFDGNCNILTVDNTDTLEPSIMKIGYINQDLCFKLNYDTGGVGDSFITKSILIKDDLLNLHDFSDVSYEGEYDTEITFLTSSFITEKTYSIPMPYTAELNFGGYNYPSDKEFFTLDKAPFNFEYDIFADTSTIDYNAIVIKVDRGFPNTKGSLRLPHKAREEVYFIHNFAEKLADFTELMSPYILNEDGTIENGCYDEYNKPRPKGYILNPKVGQTVVTNIENKNYNLNSEIYGFSTSRCGIYGYKDELTETINPPFQNRKEYIQPNDLTSTSLCIISEEENQETTVDNMFKLGIENKPGSNILGCFSGYFKGAEDRICELPWEPTEYDQNKLYNEGDVVFIDISNSQFFLSVVNNNTQDLTNLNSWKEIDFFNSVIQYMETGEYFVNRKPNVLEAIDYGTGAGKYSWSVYDVVKSGIRTYDPSGFFVPYLNGNEIFPPKLVDVNLSLSTTDENEAVYPFSSQAPSITKPFYMEMFVNKLIYCPTDIEILNNASLSSTSKYTYRKYTSDTGDGFNFIDPVANYSNTFIKDKNFIEQNGSNWEYGLRLDTRPDIIYNNSRLTINGATDFTENQIDFLGMRSEYSNSTHKSQFEPNFKTSSNFDDINTSITGNFRPEWKQGNANDAYGEKFGVYRDKAIGNVDNVSKANLMNWGSDLNLVSGTENFNLVTSNTTTIGAEQFAERWFKDLTNVIRIFFWPLYLPDDQKVENLQYKLFPYNATNRSFNGLQDNDQSIVDMIESAKEGSTQLFSTPRNYNRYFRVVPDEPYSGLDMILNDYSYNLPVTGSSKTYDQKTTLDFFIHHKYEVSPDWWSNIQNASVREWLNNNVGSKDELSIVPLFASISMKDDMKNFSSIKDKKFYTVQYNREDNNMEILENKNPIDNSDTYLNSISTFDYFEAFNSIYAKEFEVDISKNINTHANNLAKTLWSSYSAEKGEFLIGRVDDEGSGSYRLVMMQKNENFENLELYFNYPRAPAIFSMPEVEPLAITPDKYSKIYCYINNIESIYDDQYDYDTGFIQKSKAVMWDNTNFDKDISIDSLINGTTFEKEKLYWNKKYLPFNQSTMQTGYSRLGKSIPGKLAYDGWGMRGAQNVPTNTIGQYVVNIFLFNLRYNNKLMPVYTQTEASAKQVWYQHNKDPISSTDEETAKNDLDNIIDTTNWRSGAKYNKLFSLPSSTTDLTDTKWQTYLDNMWTTPGAIYQKNYDFLNIPSEFQSPQFRPEETDENLISYYNIPFYWLNNLTNFLDCEIDSQNMTDVIFYNDFIRSVFWGNGQTTYNSLMQIYNSDTLFTTAQGDQEIVDSETFDENLYDTKYGNYTKSGNSYNPSYTDIIYQILKNGYNSYNPTLFMSKDFKAVVGDISVSDIYSAKQNIISLEKNSSFPALDYLNNNLYSVIEDINAFYPVPLISSYSDIDDNYGYEKSSQNNKIPEISVNNNTNFCDFYDPASKPKWDKVFPSNFKQPQYFKHTINSFMTYQIYNNSLVNYLTQASNTMQNLNQGANMTSNNQINADTPPNDNWGVFGAYQNYSLLPIYNFNEDVYGRLTNCPWGERNNDTDIPHRLNQPIGLIIPPNRWNYNSTNPFMPVKTDSSGNKVKNSVGENVFLYKDGTFYREIASDVLCQPIVSDISNDINNFDKLAPTGTGSLTAYQVYDSIMSYPTSYRSINTPRVSFSYYYKKYPTEYEEGTITPEQVANEQELIERYAVNNSVTTRNFGSYLWDNWTKYYTSSVFGAQFFNNPVTDQFEIRKDGGDIYTWHPTYPLVWLNLLSCGIESQPFWTTITESTPGDYVLAQPGRFFDLTQTLYKLNPGGDDSQFLSNYNLYTGWGNQDTRPSMLWQNLSYGVTGIQRAQGLFNVGLRYHDFKGDGITRQEIYAQNFSILDSQGLKPFFFNLSSTKSWGWKDNKSYMKNFMISIQSNQGPGDPNEPTIQRFYNGVGSTDTAKLGDITIPTSTLVDDNVAPYINSWNQPFSNDFLFSYLQTNADYPPALASLGVSPAQNDFVEYSNIIQLNDDAPGVRNYGWVPQLAAVGNLAILDGGGFAPVAVQNGPDTWHPQWDWESETKTAANSDVYPTCFNVEFMSFMLASTYGKAVRWPYDGTSITTKPDAMDPTKYNQLYTDLFALEQKPASSMSTRSSLSEGQPGLEQLLFISHLTGLYHTIHNPYGVPINVHTDLQSGKNLPNVAPGIFVENSNTEWIASQPLLPNSMMSGFYGYYTPPTTIVPNIITEEDIIRQQLLNNIPKPVRVTLDLKGYPLIDSGISNPNVSQNVDNTAKIVSNMNTFFTNLNTYAASPTSGNINNILRLNNRNGIYETIGSFAESNNNNWNNVMIYNNNPDVISDQQIKYTRELFQIHSPINYFPAGWGWPSYQDISNIDINGNEKLNSDWPTKDFVHGYFETFGGIHQSMYQVPAFPLYENNVQQILDDYNRNLYINWDWGNTNGNITNNKDLLNLFGISDALSDWVDFTNITPNVVNNSGTKSFIVNKPGIQPVNYKSTDTDYTKALIKLDTSLFAKPLFLDKYNIEYYGGQVNVKTQYFNYAFDCMNRLILNYQEYLHGSPVDLENFSSVKTNKVLKFPLKTFYQIQSPDWGMRTSNYLPTDGAAVTLGAKYPQQCRQYFTENYNYTPTNSGIQFRAPETPQEQKNLDLGYWEGDLTTFINPSKLNVDGVNQPVTKPSLNAAINTPAGFRAIGQRIDRQNDWNTGMCSGVNQLKGVSKDSDNPHDNISAGISKNSMGMRCSGGYAEKYIYTSLDPVNPNGFQRINYHTSNDYKIFGDEYLVKYLFEYNKQNPKQLPFVYDKSFIEVFNSSDEADLASPLNDVSGNYTEHFKFLQYVLTLNSNTLSQVSEPRPLTSNYMDNGELKFNDEEFNFYDKSTSTCTEFLYEPMIITKSQDPFMWSTSDVSTQVRMALVKTGNSSSNYSYTNVIKDNKRELFQNTIFDPLDTYPEIDSWVDNNKKLQIGESFDKRTHSDFISLYPVREDLESNLGQKIFGNIRTLDKNFYEKFEDSDGTTPVFVKDTKGNIRKAGTCNNAVNDLSINGVKQSDLETQNLVTLNCKTTDENSFSFPYYSVTDSNFTYFARSSLKSSDFAPNTTTHIETTVPPTSNNTYQIYNLETRRYQNIYAHINTVEEFFDHVYNNYSDSPNENFITANFKSSSTPVKPSMNVYQNLSNMIGRSYKYKNVNLSPKTSYITPDFTFKMPSVDLTNKFQNASINSGNMAGVTTFLRNNGYVQQNPDLTWPYTPKTSSVDHQNVGIIGGGRVENEGFIPTCSPIIKKIYDKTISSFGAGNGTIPWLYGLSIPQTSDEEYGTLSYYYNDNFYSSIENETNIIPPNIGRINSNGTNYLYQKYDEKLKIDESDITFYSRFQDLMGASANYFVTNLTDPDIIGEKSQPLVDPGTLTPQEATYKVIAVTDLLDEAIPYLFEGVNIGEPENITPRPIWHRLDINGETIDFETLLFYEFPEISNNKDTTLAKSNFFLDEVDGDYQIRARVDATEAWSSVNDLTPYQQPSQLYDQIIPAYGCLHMSGGRMVWNELNYTGGTRNDEDKAISIPSRINDYYDHLIDNSETKSYKCTKYTMESNFLQGSAQRTLYENEYFSIDTNTLNLNLTHVKFTDNSATNTMHVVMYFSNLPSSNFTINDSGYVDGGTIIIPSVPKSSDTETVIKVTSGGETFQITFNNGYGSILFGELGEDGKTSIDITNGSTIYGVLPLVNGLNLNVLQSLRITGYFPDTTTSYGLYVTSDFYNEFLEDILPGEGIYINTIFNPFKLSLDPKYFFYKSNKTITNSDQTTSFEYNFYDANTPNNPTNPSSNVTKNLQRNEFYVKAPSYTSCALGFGLESSIPEDEVSYIKPQNLKACSNFINGVYIMPVSTNTIFTKIGGIRYFFDQTYVLSENPQQTSKGYMDYKPYSSSLQFENISPLEQTYAQKVLLPKIINHSIVINDKLNILDIYGFDVNTAPKSALNDIRNFISNLSTGDIIAIQQKFSTQPLTKLSVIGVDMPNYSLRVQAYYLGDSGRGQANENETLVIDSVYTYLYIYETRLALNDSSRNTIAITNMSFVEGSVIYRDENDYTSYEVIVPDFISSFDLTTSYYLINSEDQTMYNKNFNLIFYTSKTEPVQLFDVFGNYTSNDGDSSIARPFTLNEPYRQYQIVHSNEKERVYFKAISAVGRNTFPIEIDRDNDNNTFIYNSDYWNFYNSDNVNRNLNVKWEPYNVYSTNDIIYTDGDLLPYVNYNSLLDNENDIMFLLPSRYPFILYENESLNLKYYSSTQSQNTGNNPLFYKDYEESDTLKDFISNPNNPQSLGYMCSADNNTSLSYKEWKEQEYRGCENPYDIYEANGAILNFDITGIIRNNFVGELTMISQQNWNLDELLGFFDSSNASFKTKVEEITYEGNIYTFNYSNMILTRADKNYIINQQGKLVQASEDQEFITYVVNNLNGEYYFTYKPDFTDTSALNLFYIYDGGIAMYNTDNTTIQQSRIVSCCRKIIPNWGDFTIPDNLISRNDFFVYDAQNMYKNFKSNVSSNAFVTQTQTYDDSLITPDGAALYYNSKDLIDKYFPVNALHYEDIDDIPYYIEMFVGDVNTYFYPIYIINNRTFTRNKITFEQYTLTLYYDKSSYTSSTTKPPGVTRFDDVYYARIIYKGEFPYFLYENNDEGLSTTNTCVLFNTEPDISSYEEKNIFYDLLGKFLIVRYDTSQQEDPYFLLSLQNSPCELGNTAEYTTDCYSTSVNDLASQAISFIPIIKNDSGEADIGQMGKPLCVNNPDFVYSDVSKFDFSNALLIYIVPLPPDYQSDEENTIYCRLMTYFGSQFSGWMKFNRSIEINKEQEIAPINLSSEDPLMSTCPSFVSYNNMNLINTQNETTLMMGNQYIQTRLEQDVTEKQMYYTQNFKDESVFKIEYSEINKTFDIKKLEKSDCYFVVEDIKTTIDGIYNIGFNDDYILAKSFYTINSGSFERNKNYLINVPGNQNRNGVFTCSINFDQTIILTRHDQFDTFQKLKQNRLIKVKDGGKYYFSPPEDIDTDSTEDILYKIYDEQTDGVIIEDIDNYYTSYDSYTGTFIVNSSTDFEDNGIYENNYKDTSVKENDDIVYRITDGRKKNTYWVAKTQNNLYTFIEVTNLFTEVSAITNTTNDLAINELSGVQKFTKDKTLAKGLPLTNLTLKPAFDFSKLLNGNNSGNTINFSEIRENRKPLNAMNSVNNDCSMFFEFNPFLEPSILYSYTFVDVNGKLTIETLESILGGPTKNVAITNILFGYKYQFYQLDSMKKVPEFNIISGENFSLIVTYYVGKQIGTQQIITISDQGDQEGRTEYEKLIQNDSSDVPYILILPNKGPVDYPQPYTFTLSYDGNLIETFTVT